MEKTQKQQKDSDTTQRLATAKNHSHQDQREKVWQEPRFRKSYQ